jgi:hypothetical protein
MLHCQGSGSDQRNRQQIQLFSHVLTLVCISLTTYGLLIRSSITYTEISCCNILFVYNYWYRYIKLVMVHHWVLVSLWITPMNPTWFWIAIDRWFARIGHKIMILHLNMIIHWFVLDSISWHSMVLFKQN